MSYGLDFARLQTTDADEPYNGPPLTFIITGGNSYGWFRINSTTGVIRYVKQIPNGGPGIIQLKIRVSDSGKPRQSSDWTMTIYITYDSTEIKLSQKYYNVTMKSDSSIGTVVTKIQLSQSNAIARDNAIYAIVGGSQGYNVFTTDRFGNVVLNRKPIVTINRYALLVRVYNKNNQTVSGYCYVIVEINAGAFTDPKSTNTIIIIAVCCGLACIAMAIGIYYRKSIKNIITKSHSKYHPTANMTGISQSSSQPTTIINNTGTLAKKDKNTVASNNHHHHNYPPNPYTQHQHNNNYNNNHDSNIIPMRLAKVDNKINNIDVTLDDDATNHNNQTFSINVRQNRNSSNHYW